MPKSLTIETLFPDQPFYERFRLAREAGFDFLELDDWTRLDLSRVEISLAEYDLGVSCMVGDRDHPMYAPGGTDAFLEHLSQSMAVAKSFSCRSLLVRAGAAPSAGATSAILEAVRKAARQGLTLLLEPADNYDAPEEHLRCVASAGEIVRAVNSPHLRLVYNICRQLMSGRDALAVLEKNITVLGYVRIADIPTIPMAAGAERNFAIFLDTLLGELGYNGFIGFEPHSDDPAQTNLREIKNLWGVFDREIPR